MYLVRVRWLGLALLIAGCGDNASPCDYTESDDVANASSAERSVGPKGVTGVSNVCGSVDPGHYDAASQIVDVDRYRFSVAADGQILVRLAADLDATVLSHLAVRVFDTAANPTLLADIPLAGDHGAQLVQLAAGDYDLVVTGQAIGDPSGAIAYRVQLVADLHCDQSTDTPYQESADDNDAISIDFTKTPAVSAMGGTIEATGLVSTANNALHIAGTTDATPHTDSYDDRDSFAIHTDSSTNELAVRLDWTDAAADLDFYLFDPQLDTIAAGDLGASGAQEIRAFTVAPNSDYVLWVGSYKGSHAPATYDVTMCGTHFFH